MWMRMRSTWKPREALFNSSVVQVRAHDTTPPWLPGPVHRLIRPCRDLEKTANMTFKMTDGVKRRTETNFWSDRYKKKITPLTWEWVTGWKRVVFVTLKWQTERKKVLSLTLKWPTGKKNKNCCELRNDGQGRNGYREDLSNEPVKKRKKVRSLNARGDGKGSVTNFWADTPRRKGIVTQFKKTERMEMDSVTSFDMT